VLTGFASKVVFFFLVTPGFSQVIKCWPSMGKPFKRFPANFAFHVTWLKPGVNEMKVSGESDFLRQSHGDQEL